MSSSGTAGGSYEVEPIPDDFFFKFVVTLGYLPFNDLGSIGVKNLVYLDTIKKFTAKV